MEVIGVQNSEGNIHSREGRRKLQLPPAAKGSTSAQSLQIHTKCVSSFPSVQNIGWLDGKAKLGTKRKVEKVTSFFKYDISKWTPFFVGYPGLQVD